MTLLNLPLNSELIDLLLWCSQEEIEEAHRLLRAELGPEAWLPMLYRNSQSGRFYKPHHREEADFVFSDGPWRNGLLKGGEGSGKSVAGVIKDLERLRRGMNGMLASPDLVHFKKSLWPEFKRWCPWEQVVPDQQRRGQDSWEPDKPFTLTFKNSAQVICGGMDEPEKWEGSNISFAHLDEARRKKDNSAIKVMAGRIRIAGPSGEPPQMWFTTTPRKNWLYEYFGPWEKQGVDPLADFKNKARTTVLKTRDNETNTYIGYADDRGAGLNDAEKRVLLEAEWEDIGDAEKFLTSMTFWDTCIDSDLGPHNPSQAMVLAADCGTVSDCFALVGVCRHPVRHDEIAVRYCRLWKPTPGNPVSLMEVEKEIVELAERLHIVQIAYDPYQLKSMMERLYVNHGIWTEEFNQMAPREKADKQLLDMITNRQVWHDGTFSDLREHLDNADQKKSGVEGEQKMRIVKRESSQKVDAAVAFSMAVDRCLELNLY